MKKITLFSCLTLLLCLFSGIKNTQAQCGLNFVYTQGTNGQVNFTGTVAVSTFTNYFYWYLPGSNNPVVQGTGSGFLNPSATYSANGIYTVTFGMSSAVPMCSVNITQTISVTSVSTTPPCTLLVNFTAPSPNLCNGSATVASAGNMCGPVTYTWVPVLSTGASVGGLCQGTSYTVYASSPAGVNCCTMATGVVNIPTVNPCALNANFSWTQGSGGLVNFNNTSSGTNGGSTYSWTFGDGGTSTNASPAHTYANNGVYTVVQTVNNNLSPACIDTQTYTVYVSSICNLSAGFTFNNQTSNIINFVNGTTGNFGPVGYSWNFGDNTPASTSPNPQHTYNNVGTYTVTLTANNYSISGGCTSSATAVVNISTICVASASFSLSPTGTPQFWNAFPLISTNIIAAAWSWGDGNTSNTLYTSHAYATAGQYSICLTVTASCGATAISCASYSIYRPTQSSNVVHVNVVDPSIATSIENNTAETLNFNVYPNPISGSFNLYGLKDGPVSIAVYNLVGKLVYVGENSAVNGSLAKDVQLNSVSNGVYFVKINSNNQVITKKIIVEK